MDQLVYLLAALPYLAPMPQPAVGPVVPARFAAVAVPPTAIPVEDSVFRYSEAYYRRLDVHRVASYAILPLFAFQYAAGTQLYAKGADAPAWARTGHRIGATGVAALFAVNATTGVMNLWEGRRDPDRGARPVVHGVMMLTAAAGFTATGLLAERAERSHDDRRLHRTVALSSMGVATAAYLLMLDIFRKD